MVQRNNTEGIDLQTIELPLKVGSYISLYEYREDVDGWTEYLTYQERVEKHVPETGLIRMSDGTGRAKLFEKIAQADGYTVRGPTP